MRIMGLDIGDVRIGIALSDERAILASGVESYTRKNEQTDVEYIAKSAAALGASRIVVGLPINMNGTEGPQATKMRAFAAALGKHTSLPVVFYDERLTTAQAERTLIKGNVSRQKRRKVIDKLAAQLILQSYLDAHGGDDHD